MAAGGLLSFFGILIIWWLITKGGFEIIDDHVTKAVELETSLNVGSGIARWSQRSPRGFRVRQRHLLEAVPLVLLVV